MPSISLKWPEYHCTTYQLGVYLANHRPIIIIHRGWHASTEKRLLDQARDRTGLKNYAHRIEKSYLYWINLLPNRTLLMKYYLLD